MYLLIFFAVKACILAIDGNLTGVEEEVQKRFDEILEIMANAKADLTRK